MVVRVFRVLGFRGGSSVHCTCPLCLAYGGLAAPILVSQNLGFPEIGDPNKVP